VPNWFGKKTDWNDLRRISTGLAVVGTGAGHSMVTLSASADLVMAIGEGDEPQEITLDVQNAFTGWLGPITAACTDIPTFRYITTCDLNAAGMLGIPAFTFSTTAAEGTGGSLVRHTAQIAIFDVTAPTTIYENNAAAVGSASGAARYDHDHGISHSNNPGASASILATATDGGLQLLRLGIGTDPDTDSAVKVADNAWVGLGSGAGRLVFDITPNPDQIQLAAADLYLPASHGVIHADGVTAGQFLRANGTRYVPDTIDIADITDLAYATPNLTLGTANAAGAANSVIRSDATVAIFDATVPDVIQCDDGAATGAVAKAARRDHTHGIVCAAPGADSVNIVASAEGVATSFARSDHAHNLEEAITPTWTGDHTWDDGASDSPALHFVGGSNDDTVSVFLDDDATAGDSDLVVRLCSADAHSWFEIQSNAPATVAYIDAAGDLLITGNFEIDVASGDPIIIFDTDGADKFTVGVDDDDSDIFKISGGGALGASDWFSVAADGDVGFRCNSAAANVEIEDGGTGNTVLLKVTADDGNVYNIMLGNDTSSTTDTHGLGLLCRESGAGYIWTHSGATRHLMLQPNGFAHGCVGIGLIDTDVPLGRLDVYNLAEQAARSVLALLQEHVTLPFIRLWGTSANGNLTYSLVEEGDQASAALAGWAKVDIQDDGDQITDQIYYIPFYTLAA